MRLVTAAFQIFFQPFGLIAFIQTEREESPAKPARLKGIEGIGNQLDVMGIGPRHNQ